MAAFQDRKGCSDLSAFHNLTFWTELLKMSAQLAGALLVARLTVNWALHRYKLEKAWDRQATEIFGILDALAELEDLVSGWLDAEYSGSEPTDDDGHSRGRFLKARSTVRQASATASIVLPQQFEKMFADLVDTLDQEPEYDEYAEAYERELTAIRRTRAAVVIYGQSKMGLGPKK